jgi:hypothetical protein
MTKKEAFMHHVFSRGGASVWLSLLLVLPVVTLPAASLAPLGTLRCDGVVYVGGNIARLGSVIYSGDQVKTAEGRATISLPRGDLMVLDRESTAALQRSPEGLSVGLEKGRVIWALATQGPLRVQADGLTFAPTGAVPSLAEVAMRGDGTLVAAVHRGKISIAELRADPVVVSAGQLITIDPRLAQSGPQPAGTGAHGKMTLGEKLRTFRIGSLSHQASVAVVAGVVGAAAATAIAVPLAVGEEEKVSPSVP